MKQIKTTALCFLLLALSGNTVAQFGKLDTVPLFKFFQKNFDSTVVWFLYSSWNAEPNYKVVSRIENRSFYFTYNSPYHNFNGRSLPKVLRDRFNSMSNLYKSVLPDTNQFFLPKSVYYTNNNTIWDAIKVQNIWSLLDDKTDSSKCTKSAMDAGEHDFILITKSAIRLLNYYNMTDCPKNINRQKIRKIMDAFNTVFGKWY